MHNQFGEFIAKKRNSRGITLRGMSNKLGIAAPYLSDIEKGRRNPPNYGMLEKFSSVLELSEDERNEMFDYAGAGRNQVSPDLPEYIMDIPEARTALRKARDMKKDAEFWTQIAKSLDTEDG